MAIPIQYNIRSVKQRWLASLVAILAIAGVVGVFDAVLAMSRGFQQTLVSSGAEDNAIVLRGGANTEMESSVSLEQSKIIADSAGVKRGPDDIPLMSAEIVVVASLPLLSSGTDANVQVRGVGEKALDVRNSIKITEGRPLKLGVAELIVGKNASNQYMSMKLDDTITFGGLTWNVVGIFDAGGSAFDSEVWCDARVLAQAYKRPETEFQSVTVKLESPDAFTAFKDTLTADPRLTITAQPEKIYYGKQSEMVSTLINVLGFLVAGVMALGAIIGALNTMYSSIVARSQEIAALRAIGFRSGSVITSFTFESLFIAFIGALIGSVVILPLNGFTASTINWQTFSHMAFAFQVTPGIILQGIIFALIMGFLGGLFPAVRAARMPIIEALRGL